MVTRRWSMVLASVFALAGCSIFGPLDGISGGPEEDDSGRDGGRPVTSTDGGREEAGEPPDEEDEDSGSAPSCPGVEGVEPEGAGTVELSERSHEFCGTVSAGDTDVFQFTATIHDIHVAFVDKNGGGRISYMRSGVTITTGSLDHSHTSAEGAMRVSVTITATSATPTRYTFSLTQSR